MNGEGGQRLSSFALALGFLTRLPVPARSPSGPAFAWVLFWFPCVGALLGGVLVCTQWLVEHTSSPTLASACTVALWVWLTGGLHLDGVADSADAWSAAHGDVTRSLDVMRDSRIGAHGAVALIVLLLLKLAAVAHLASVSDGQLVALVAAPAVARFLTATALLGFPAARATGMGAKFRRSASWGPTLFGALWPVLACTLPGYVWGEAWAEATLGSLAAAVTVFGIGWSAKRSFGGLTGDVCGAMIEWSEVAYLVAWGCRA